MQDDHREEAERIAAVCAALVREARRREPSCDVTVGTERGPEPFYSEILRRTHGAYVLRRVVSDEPAIDDLIPDQIYLLLPTSDAAAMWELVRTRVSELRAELRGSDDAVE